MSQIKLTASLLLVLVSLSIFLDKGKCNCAPPSGEQQTSWGQENVIIKHDEIIKSLRGKVEVETNEEALAGVLVEVYDKPEGLLKDWKEREASKTQQRRIAACVTGSDGEFCFSDLPAGKYELRCSKPNGWNSTSVYVVLAPSDSRKNSPLTVPMQVSQ